MRFLRFNIVPGQEREQDRFKGSSEGAAKEHVGASRGHEGALKEHEEASREQRDAAQGSLNW